MFNRVSHPSLLAGLFAFTAMLCLTAGLMAQEVPFTGQINQDNVTLRAGAGTPYYIVGNAGKGTRVVVAERIADWYKITPPPGIYSYVSKAFVDVRGDGSTGTATQRLSSYAASVNGPGESYRRQLELLTGDVVKIVAQEGSYFKIEPPKGAYVYVQTQYITPVEEVISSPQTPDAPETPAAPKAPAPEAPAAPEARQTPAAPTQPRQAEPARQPTADRSSEPSNRTDSATRTHRAAETASEQPSQPQPDSPRPAATDTASNDDTAAAQAAGDQGDRSRQDEPASPASTQESASADASASDDPRSDASPSDSPSDSPAEPVEVVVDEPVRAASSSQDKPQQQRPLVVSPDLLAAEQAFYEAQKLPVEKQPLEKLLEQYQQVQSSRSLTAGDQRVLSVRIAQIQRNMTLAKAINDLKEVRRDLRPSTTILVPPPPAPERGNYDAMGVLLASSVYDGQTLPRLYRLVTSGEGRTIAYIRPTGNFDVAEALGSTVGIQGQTRYDTALKIRVIDAQQLVILEPAVQR